METEVRFYCQRVTQELTFWLVGTIGDRTDPAANTQLDGSLNVTLSTPALIPNEIENKVKNSTASPEPRPPSLSKRPPPSLRGYAQRAIPNYRSFIAEEGVLSRTPVVRSDHYSYDRGRFRSSKPSIPRISPSSDGIPRPRSYASTMPIIPPALPTTMSLGSVGMFPYPNTLAWPSMLAALPVTGRSLGSGGTSLPYPNTSTSRVLEAHPSGRFSSFGKMPRPHYNTSTLSGVLATPPITGRSLGSSRIPQPRPNTSTSRSLAPPIPGMTYGKPRPRPNPSILPSVLAPLPRARSASAPAPPISYVAETAFDHGLKQRRRSESITFSTNGLPGVNMRDPRRKRFTGLEGRDDLVLQGAGYPSNISTQVRALVPVVLSYIDCDRRFQQWAGGRTIA